MMESFFKINASAETSGNQEDTVEIFGVIGNGWEGNDDNSFVNRVKNLSGKSLRVQINSFGGDLKSGLGIANFLRASGKEITTVCMGVAASAASLIFCAGSKRIMRAGSQLMIHNSAVLAYGNSGDLEKTAEVLDGFDDSMADFYAIATGAEKQAVKAMMDAETWMSSDKAVELGFATEKEAALKAVATAAPAFAYAFKHPSNVMPSASLSHPALLQIAAFLQIAPENESELITAVQSLASQLNAANAATEQHKADLTAVKASLASANDALTASKAETEKVKASVNAEVARICHAAGLKTPVNAEKLSASANRKEMTLKAFQQLPDGQRNSFIREGGKLTD